MKLYEISGEYRNLLANIEAGEIPEEAIADTLEAIQGELIDKVESIACMIKELESDIASLATEEKALAERRKAKERQVDFFTTYVAEHMIAAGIQKIDRPHALVKITKSKSTEISDESAFIEWAELNHRDDLLNYKISPAKTNIKKSIESGAEIPFAAIVEKQKASVK